MDTSKSHKFSALTRSLMRSCTVLQEADAIFTRVLTASQAMEVQTYLPYSQELAWLLSAISRSWLNACASRDACARHHQSRLAWHRRTGEHLRLHRHGAFSE